MSHTPLRLKVSLIDLDGQPLADWVPKRLAEEGVSLHVHQCERREDLAQHAGAAEVVWLFGGKPTLKGNLDVIPRCWAVIRTGSGTDNVPVAEATERGIIVANTPAAFTDGVSDHMIALLFAVLRRVVALDQAVRQGRWDQVVKQPVNGVKGRTLGLVGFGLIPKEIVCKLSGFGLTVLAFDPFVPRDVMAQFGVEAVDLDALLARADFVSLHCPLTDQTRHLIGERQLRTMKPGAILLNTARGPVVDESALVRALAEGRLAGAGLDVFEREPPASDNPLFQLDNVVMTAHSAGNGADGLEARWRLSVETVLALANRQWPASCVNPTVKPRHELTRPLAQN